MKSIVFTGGGTGGHIFPGLAIIEEFLKKSDLAVYWIGSSRGVDRELVSGAGISFKGIPTGKLRRYASFQNFTDIFRIAGGFFVSLGYLLKDRPLLVFSKGGFVSVPVCCAAWVLRIPVFTHECDFSPGLATRINSLFAKKILVTYDETKKFFSPSKQQKAVVVGNPVRSAFYSAHSDAGRIFLGADKSGLPILLVLGGSLGARQVNELVSRSLKELCRFFIVVHQTGPSHFDQTELYDDPETAGRYKPYPFIRDEMADVLASASLVVARAGANTVWECAAAGKPMILIPLEKGSSRGDQVENAHFFETRGAAVSLTGENASAEKLCSVVSNLAQNPDALVAMASASARLIQANPAQIIADMLIETTIQGPV